MIPSKWRPTWHLSAQLVFVKNSYTHPFSHPFPVWTAASSPPLGTTLPLISFAFFPTAQPLSRPLKTPAPLPFSMGGDRIAEETNMAEFADRFSLIGKNALVTGASKGIGREICRVLADAGADIVAVARDQQGLADAKTMVERLGRRCLIVEADLATVDGPRHAAATALQAWGVIDILVNNAGITAIESILEAEVESWDRIMAVNLRAPFLLAQALAPRMIEKHSGKIVNVSSQTSEVALENHAAYMSSKSGLNALTKVMTVEWAKHNIQSNAVCPTVIMTPMGEMVWGDPKVGDPMRAKIPLGRFGKPVEIADLVLFLASPASDLITGQVIFADGGFTAQ
jgi:2-deoxy-D-gluconate 3-dehydrogenase